MIRQNYKFLYGDIQKNIKSLIEITNRHFNLSTKYITSFIYDFYSLYKSDNQKAKSNALYLSQIHTNKILDIYCDSSTCFSIIDYINWAMYVFACMEFEKYKDLYDINKFSSYDIKTKIWNLPSSMDVNKIASQMRNALLHNDVFMLPSKDFETINLFFSNRKGNNIESLFAIDSKDFINIVKSVSKVIKEDNLRSNYQTLDVLGAEMIERFLFQEKSGFNYRPYHSVYSQNYKEFLLKLRMFNMFCRANLNLQDISNFCTFTKVKQGKNVLDIMRNATAHNRIKIDFDNNKIEFWDVRDDSKDPNISNVSMINNAHTYGSISFKDLENLLYVYEKDLESTKV